jgi:hypothetical protein
MIVLNWGYHHEHLNNLSHQFLIKTKSHKLLIQTQSTADVDCKIIIDAVTNSLYLNQNSWIYFCEQTQLLISDVIAIEAENRLHSEAQFYNHMQPNQLL